VTGGYRVRPFDPSRDVQPLRECLIEQQDFHRGIEPSWPDGTAIADEYFAYLQKQCASNNGRIFMADVAGDTAGFICVVAEMRGESPEDPAPSAWVHELYVKPAHRRSGVASALLAEAERFARGEGANRIRLGVLEGNGGARSLYDRLGFLPHAHVLTKPLE
jgi:GNAT superfamily N-acetyltransferase